MNVARYKKGPQPPGAAHVDTSTMKDGRDQDDFERDDAALWALMGKVPPPAVSPYFARRVLRETVRLEEDGSPLGRWLRRWSVPHPAWSGAFAAALVGIVSLSFAFRDTPGHAPARQREVREEISARDVEVIANLDNLMAYEENRIWTDESNTD